MERESKIKFKHLLVVGLTLSLMLNTGCISTAVNIAPKKYSNYETVQEETSTDVANLNDHTDKQYQRYIVDTVEEDELFLNPNQKIIYNNGKETKQITYKELVTELDGDLLKKYNDYKLVETLQFDYKNISKENVVGVYLYNENNESRQQDQYYKDEKKKTGQNSVSRNILAVRYKNKKNLEYEKGEFSTKQLKKPVELEWSPIDPDTEQDKIDKLLAIKEYNFCGLKRFYEFNSKKDYKAQGRTTLREFKKWLGITNAGTQTLKDVEAKVKRNVIKEGVTTEETAKVVPMLFEFNYDITVKDKTITIEADLTDTLKDYYTLFPNYEIITCKYTLNITEIESEVKDETVEDETKEDIKATGSDIIGTTSNTDEQ